MLVLDPVILLSSSKILVGAKSQNGSKYSYTAVYFFFFSFLQILRHQRDITWLLQLAHGRDVNQRSRSIYRPCHARGGAPYSRSVADRRSLQHALQLKPFSLLYRTYAIIYACATNAHSLFCCPSCLEAVHIRLRHVSTFRIVKIRQHSYNW